jgi:hypothetical protein
MFPHELFSQQEPSFVSRRITEVGGTLVRSITVKQKRWYDKNWSGVWSRQKGISSNGRWILTLHLKFYLRGYECWHTVQYICNNMEAVVSCTFITTLNLTKSAPWNPLKTLNRTPCSPQQSQTALLKSHLSPMDVSAGRSWKFCLAPRIDHKRRQK